ncbi:hypothetical protein L218DRAFT_954575 [Marasmius fiardii PR-910]|nr:hypothetical protein L218DRAFT_954575 [Marasmius fiardii PR-910]
MPRTSGRRPLRPLSLLLSRRSCSYPFNVAYEPKITLQVTLHPALGRISQTKRIKGGYFNLHLLGIPTSRHRLDNRRNWMSYSLINRSRCSLSFLVLLQGGLASVLEKWSSTEA